MYVPKHVQSPDEETDHLTKTLLLYDTVQTFPLPSLVASYAEYRGVEYEHVPDEMLADQIYAPVVELYLFTTGEVYMVVLV